VGEVIEEGSLNLGECEYSSAIKGHEGYLSSEGLVVSCSGFISARALTAWLRAPESSLRCSLCTRFVSPILAFGRRLSR
jgi:hypothetical protein